MSDDPFVRIVEDSKILVEMLGTLMEMEGISYCTTTRDFQVLLDPGPWDGVTAVLCDLDLGGPVTGEMVLEYLRESHPWIKRVILSAVVEASKERISYLAHVVLSKPANLSDIAEAVRK